LLGIKIKNKEKDVCKSMIMKKKKTTSPKRTLVGKKSPSTTLISMYFQKTALMRKQHIKNHTSQLEVCNFSKKGKKNSRTANKNFKARKKIYLIKS